jgi:phospholipid/cholesterol/gamma-HCH transport system substrate-binding protein
MNTDFPIPDNSIARIFSSDLMGSKAIELALGNSQNYIQDGDTLPTDVEASLKDAVNQQIRPLKNKAEDLIKSIDSVVVMVQAVFNKKSREDIANALESVKNTLNSLESASYNIDTIVKSQAGRLANILYNLDMITTNIESNNDKIDRIIDNFASISDSLAKAEIPRTFNNINSTVNDLAVIAEKINSGEGTLGMLINDDELYFNLRKASSDLDLLLEDIKNNPKRYVRFSIF